MHEEKELSTGGKLTKIAPEPLTVLNHTSQGDHSTAALLGDGVPFKVCISDYITVRGDDGSKFTSWKVTAFVRGNSSVTRIRTYKRYSDFLQLRRALLERLLRCHDGDDDDYDTTTAATGETAPSVELELPELPPKVAWYDSWHYNEVNFDKKWLAERQRGLERFLNGILQNREIVRLCRAEIVAFFQ